MISKLLNEDNTEYNPPINPIVKKYSKNCTSYQCMFCDECPYGDDWKCPESETEEYKKYQQAIADYDLRHNPTLEIILHN